MSASVCLVTTGQPSTNPRAVKEADALTAAGYEVRLVGAHWATWADETDPALLATRPWTCELVEWRRSRSPFLYWYTRARHRAARLAATWPGIGATALPAAVSRLTPELSRRAGARRADLFIAHNLGALPAAAMAAERWGAKLGFDAEDFHTGQFPGSDQSSARLVTTTAERTWLPRCDFVTAASPGIGAAYAGLCRRPPVVVRNAFPLSQRPERAPEGSPDGVLRLYWFSQSIGASRGLEDIVRGIGGLPAGAVQLHLRGAWLGEYERALRDVARSVGVDQGQIVAHRPAPPDDMARLAACYDVGLALEPGHTANSDLAESNKVMTYLLAGVPVLCTATSGHRTLLGQAPGVGWLVPAGDVAAVRALLADLLANRQRLREAAGRAWEAGGTRFNWDREQAVFLAEVERVVGTRAPAVA